MAGFHSPHPARTDPLLSHAAAAAASLRLHHSLRHGLSLGFIYHSSSKSCSLLGYVPQLKHIVQAGALQITGLNCLGSTFNSLSATLTSLSFFHGHESGNDSSQIGNVRQRRLWTNILLASNVIVYLADVAMRGTLFWWGAKINSRINDGQLWRLVTSSLLHRSIEHLMLNCYSLNAIGPTVERVCGPKRYLMVYVTATIASSFLSYWFNNAPSVGASGAIFGLVGSYAVYLLRHRRLFDTRSHLRHVAQVLLVNMTIGVLGKQIDNWGHVGGLIGGAAVSWLIGPAWKLSFSDDGKWGLMDKPPIHSLIQRHPK